MEAVVAVAVQLAQRLVQPARALRLQRFEDQEPPALARGIDHRAAPVGDADEQAVRVQSQPAPVGQLVARREHAVLQPRPARGTREELVAVARDRQQIAGPLEQDQGAHGLLFIV